MLTLSEYEKAWQRARESTSSLPSWIHFRHYMTTNQDPELQELSVYLADISLQTGVTPRRWWQSIKIMLEKVAGLNQVDKLHIIHLFEADFNANNKWLGQVIMTLLLAEEQHGSCKQQSAIVQCLYKFFWYDLIFSTRILVALCLNDIKSCYDQIILLIAALCTCWFGATKLVVFSMINTIHIINHHICTIFGDSQRYTNQSAWDKPIVGIGQGNSTGPWIWVAVCLYHAIECFLHRLFVT